MNMINVMKEAPDTVGGAKVILSVEERKATGKTKHTHVGKLANSTVGLAICKQANEDGYYLFGCDVNWESETDTWCESVEEAIEQAEWAY